MAAVMCAGILQREDLVERNQWLTSSQLLDAVAIGQLTPGPVFTTATFIGYLLAGNAGAIAGTISISASIFARLVRESSGAKAASIQLGKRFSGWGECSLTGANGRSHL